MPTYAHRVVSASFELNLPAMRVVSAVRRGAVVLIALVAVNSLLGVSIAVNAATAAFLVGLADKGGSPRATWEVMGVATVFLSALSFVLGHIATEKWLIVIILMIMATLIPTSGVINPRAPQIFVFGALYTSSQLISTPSPDKVLPGAILILACGALQTVTTLLASPVIADLPERRVAVDALRAVADSCVELSTMGNELRELNRDATRAFGKAESTIRKCDIEAETRELFLTVLNDADLIRVEARALYARSHMGIRYPNDALTYHAFGLAAEVLELAAIAIEKRRPAEAMHDLDNRVNAIKRQFEGEQISRTAASVLRVIYEIPDHVRSLAGKHDVSRRAVHNSVPLADRARVAFDPKQITMRIGLRMAAAALVGIGIAELINLPHGSWVATTALMVLRPDGGPTAPRIVMRAVGTTLAVGLVIAVLAIIGDNTAVIFAIIGITAAAAYSLVAVNYGFYAASVAATMVMIYSLTYPQLDVLAFGRWIDVVIGCVIAAIFAVAIPVWSHKTLMTQLAKYVDAVGGWFQALGAAALAEPDQRDAPLAQARLAGGKARDLQLMVSSTYRTTLVEPASHEVDTGAVGVMLAWMRRCSDAGVACETILRHGLAGGPNAKALADITASDLRQTAAILRTDYADRPTADQLPDDLRQQHAESAQAMRHGADNRATSALANAEVSAAAALRASYRLNRSKENISE